LCRHPEGAVPRTYALLALFCFHAARLPGRIDADGFLIPLEFQDRTTWDRSLIVRGFGYLEQSSVEIEVSEFHLEAAIAAIHSGTERYESTDWSGIVEVYDLLYAMKPTPIVALNRAIAVGMARGAEAGLVELAAIPEREKLRDYPFLPAAEGEFLRRAGRVAEARSYFEQALALARNPAEARFLERKIAAMSGEG
jgi:RNA polymerase sigma-70 factor (ECF subfamily)